MTRQKFLIMILASALLFPAFIPHMPPVYAAVDCVTPTGISDLVAWYDASAISTITKDGTDRVSQWNDRSGNGHHLTQATGGSQPLWVSADRDGKDIIDFVGDRFMRTAAGEEWTLLSQPIHIFVVAEGGDGRIIDGADATNRAIITGSSSVNDRVSIASLTSLDATVTDFEDFWHYMGALFDSPDSELRVDGSLVIATGDSGAAGNDGITVSANYDGTLFNNKKVAEIIIYDKEVTGTELTSLENYLASKWGFVNNCIPNPPENLTAVPQGVQVQFDWIQTNGTFVDTYFIGRSLDNSTWPAVNKTNVGNVTSYLDSAYYRPGLLYYVNVTAGNAGFNSTSSFTNFIMDNVPDAPTLSLSPISETQINATSTAGASDGGDPVKDFALRCELNSAGSWDVIVANSTLPANRSHDIGGYWNDGDLIKCQWRDGNLVGWSAWSANGTYPARPDAVTDLSVVAVFQTTAEILWGTPNLHGLNLTGYQVNFTSPWGNPQTIITTTNNSDTEYIISGLVPNTQYSFRVSAVTIAGNNATGNIVNIQTPTDFVPGQIEIDDTNPLRMPIRFTRDDINSTTTALTVTYSNEYDLTCDMYFKFAQSNQTFSNINGTAVSSSEDENTFYFLNPGTEVINVNCRDVTTNTTGTYVMMQSDFILLDLISGFRDGTYGTAGQFGAIDLITLLAIILGMIGFNRTNPAVGVVFMFFIMGGLATFGIVQWYTAVTGLVATLLLFAVASTRKEN